MGRISQNMWVAFALLTVGIILLLVGINTNSWQHRFSNSGLFRECATSKLNSNTGCVGITANLEWFSARWITVECVVGGAFFGIVSWIILALYIIGTLIDNSVPDSFLKVAPIACFTCLGLMILGIIIYIFRVFDMDHGSLGYSFLLSILGAILIGVTGAVLLKETNQSLF